MDSYIIKKVLSGLPEWFVDVLKKNKCYIAGGAITSVVNRTDISDYDIYFPNNAALLDTVKCIQDDNPHCCFISDKSLTYALDSDTTVQFIHYDYYDKPEDIHKHFDFTINMATIDMYSDRLVCHPCFMLHNSQRYLSFNKDTKFPMISALRVQKYKERGYDITRAQYMKILMAINKLEINSWEDFSAAVGNLYGLNFIEQSQLVGDFSLDKAFELVENTDFDGESIVSYKWEPSVVDIVLSKEPIKCSRLLNGDLVTLHDNEQVIDLLETGAVAKQEIPLKELIGDKLYKWVTPELKSIYYSSFSYVLGEVAEGTGTSSGFMSTRKPVGLYCNTAKDLLNNCGSHRKDKVCLELSYEEEDIISVSDREITVQRVTPLRKLTEQEFKTEILGG